MRNKPQHSSNLQQPYITRGKSEFKCYSRNNFLLENVKFVEIADIDHDIFDIYLPVHIKSFEYIWYM